MTPAYAGQRLMRWWPSANRLYPAYWNGYRVTRSQKTCVRLSTTRCIRCRHAGSRLSCSQSWMLCAARPRGSKRREQPTGCFRPGRAGPRADSTLIYAGVEASAGKRLKARLPAGGPTTGIRSSRGCRGGGRAGGGVGEGRRQAALAEAERNAQAIVAQAQAEADMLQRAGERQMVAAVARAFEIVIGDPHET